MTPRQKAFVAEYLVDLNATQAAIRAGYDLRECGSFRPARYYVYLLVDPRDGWVFYVGKGKGKRYSHHEAEWRRGETGNRGKFEAFEAIDRSGLRVSPRCLVDGLAEREAYALEREMIEALGDRLTNIQDGGSTLAERDAIRAASMLARLLPFDEWSMGQPAERLQSLRWLYDRVVQSLQDIEAGVSIRSLVISRAFGMGAIVAINGAEVQP